MARGGFRSDSGRGRRRRLEQLSRTFFVLSCDADSASASESAESSSLARAVEAHLSSAVGVSGASLALCTNSWPFSCSKTASSILNLPWCASHRPDTSMGLSGHRRGSRLDCMRRYPTRCSPLRAPAHPTPSRDHVVDARASRRTRRATRRSATPSARAGAPGGKEVKANIAASVSFFLASRHTRGTTEYARREGEARGRTCEAARRDARGRAAFERAPRVTSTRDPRRRQIESRRRRFFPRRRGSFTENSSARPRRRRGTGTGTMVQQQTRGHPRSP